jgi:MFS family permease
VLNVLDRRDLLITLAGRTTSIFGDMVALTALTLRLQADGSRPYEVALLLAAGSIPVLFLARPVGRLVDSHDSRHLLIGAGVAETACTAPLIVMHSVVAIVILVAVLGAAASVTGTTWSALIPRIAGEDHVAEAISTLETAGALAMVGSPAVGGLLAGAFGTGVPLAIDTATFILVTAAAGLVRTRRKVPAPTADVESARARGGFEILRADRLLAVLLIGVGLVVLLVGMVDVVLVFLVRVTLHAGGAWYGVVQAAWMAGIVAGSLGAGRLRAQRHQTWATTVGIGVICAALATFSLASAIWILIPLSVIGGIGNGYATACFATLLVSRTRDAERGRVSAAANAILSGSQGVSLLLGGVVAAVLSPRPIYAIAGALGLAATLALALVCTPHANHPV